MYWDSIVRGKWAILTLSFFVGKIRPHFGLSLTMEFPNTNLMIQGEHILIDREDRRSQLKTFKEGINYLKKGVPIMAFPEGQRSKDGHLMEFKGGLFAMAAKTNVPIVPITLSHTHSIMPSNALFPVQPGSGKLHVHIHEAINTAGKSEEELVALVRESFLKTLPLEQHPLQRIPSAEELQALTEQQRKAMQPNTNTTVSV